MTTTVLFIAALMIALAAFIIGKQRAEQFHAASIALGEASSLPRHHGYYLAAQAFFPAMFLALAWLAFGDNVALAAAISSVPPDIAAAQGNISLLTSRIEIAVYGRLTGDLDAYVADAAQTYRLVYSLGLWAVLTAIIGLSALILTRAFSKIRSNYPARERFETIVERLLLLSSLVAVLTTIGIILTLVVESSLFFRDVTIPEFLFGTKWSPQTALREDQIGASGSFGALPLFAGTVLITVIAIIVAAPVGLFAAIYLTQYASPGLRAIAKPCLEILAGIPTVVYGFFAAVTVAPFLSDIGQVLGVAIASESALAAGLVMGIMIIPFVSSLADDALTAVPRALKDGALAMGATQSEAISGVLIPAASHGIMSALLLAISRAMGETMIVVMAAGLRPVLTGNPLDAVTTVTVQIVSLLTGDQVFDSTKTLSAFALGLALFVFTLIFNLFAQQVSRRYQRLYD